MTIVSVTFTCSRCRREVKEIDDGNAIIHEMYPNGGSRAHAACKECRKVIKESNAVIAAEKLAPKPPGISVPMNPAASNAGPQQDAALVMVAQALLQLSKQNDQIIALLSKPAEAPPAESRLAVDLLNDPIMTEEEDV